MQVLNDWNEIISKKDDFHCVSLRTTRDNAENYKPFLSHLESELNNIEGYIFCSKENGRILYHFLVTSKELSERIAYCMHCFKDIGKIISLSECNPSENYDLEKITIDNVSTCKFLQ